MQIRAILAVLAVFVAMAQGQSIGFAQMEGPGLWGEKAESTIRDASEFVANASALSWGVLQTNRLELQHRLDFIVISLDFGVFKPDAKMAAQDMARFLRGASTQRIVLQAGPCLQSDEVRRRYVQFVAELRQLMVRHTLIDLSGATYELGEYTLIGADSADLGSSNVSRKRAELERVSKSLGRSRTALLFSTIERMPANGKLEAASLWKDAEWSRIAKNPRIAGLFVSVLGNVPQTGPMFPTPGKDPPTASLHIVPRLGIGVEAPGRGLLFARVARNGAVASTPIWMRADWADAGEDLGNLVIDAGIKEQNQEYKDAYKLYDDALKSKDPHVRTAAEAGLRRTDEALQGWWERWKAESVGAKWFADHWRDLLAALVVFFCFTVWRFFSTRQVQLAIPNKLSTNAPAELFWLHFLDSISAIESIWSGIPQGMPTPRHQRIYLAPSVGKSIAEDLGDVKLPGVDVGAIVKWVSFLWRYFSWRIEVSVYGTDVQTVAYARLCWGWYTRRTWMRPTSSTGPLAVQRAAWALACAVIMDGA